MEPGLRTRASHDDRSRVTEVLAGAYADGRLDHEEFEERTSAAGGARYLDELAPLVGDLRVEGAELVPAPVRLPATHPASLAPSGSQGSAWSVGVLGGQERSGAWQVAPRHTGVFVMGGGTIDLRQAVFNSPEVVLTITAIMGGCTILVTPDTEVVCHGIGIMGGFGSDRATIPADPSRPRVVVRGLAVWGGCGIVRKELGE